MAARLAYPLIYATAIDGASDDQRLEIDALLGDPDAAAEMQRRRFDAMADAGFEVG